MASLAMPLIVSTVHFQWSISDCVGGKKYSNFSNCKMSVYWLKKTKNGKQKANSVSGCKFCQLMKHIFKSISKNNAYSAILIGARFFELSLRSAIYQLIEGSERNFFMPHRDYVSLDFKSFAAPTFGAKYSKQMSVLSLVGRWGYFWPSW